MGTKRGSVVRCSLNRAIPAGGVDFKRSSPFLNPAHCLGSENGHWCHLSLIPRAKKKVHLHPDRIWVSHFVELLSDDAGRCERILHTPCYYRDLTLARQIAPLLT